MVYNYQFTKIKTQAIFTESMRLSDDFRLQFSQRAYYDGIFSLTDHYPDEVENDQKSDTQLRKYPRPA